VTRTLAPGSASDGRRPRSGPSVKPALVVVAIAAGLVLLFGVGAALTGTNTPAPAKRGHVGGARLAASAAAGPLKPIELPGTPPPDVLGSLVVPKGARTVETTRWDGETQYSAKMGFELAASQGALVDFYRAELAGRGWSMISVGAAHGNPKATEVLAQKGSDDGWYWEVGVVVAPTTFGKGTSSETTRFSLELFEEPDAL
jgi:hypothetical protein